MVKNLGLMTPTIRSTETRTFNGDGCPVEWLLETRDFYEGIEREPKSFFVRGTYGHQYIADRLAMIERDTAMQTMLEDLRLFISINPDPWIETTKCTKEGLEDELVGIAYAWEAQQEEYYREYTVDVVEYPLTFSTPNGSLVMTTIDALFRNEDGRPIIVDWKLGTSKSGKPMQLYVYWYGLKKAGLVSEADFFRGWFHYVNYADPIQLVGDYPGDDMVEAYIDLAFQRRANDVKLPNPEWFSCRYCYYKEECPMYADDPHDAWEYVKSIQVEVI